MLTPDGTVALGMWINKRELDRLSMSGTQWGHVLTAADMAPSQWGDIDIQNNSSAHSVNMMAAALVYARKAGHHADAATYRNKVASELRRLVDHPLSEGSITGPARQIGAYAVSADLIDLPRLDAGLDQRFKSWLLAALDKPLSGAGGSVRGQAITRGGGNTRMHAAWSVTTAELYRGNRTAVERVNLATMRGYGMPVDVKLDWTTDAAEVSWQLTPAIERNESWYSVHPVGASKDGHNFDGVMPNDYRRNGLYTAATFPGDGSVSSYPDVAMEGLVAFTHVLERAGYPAAAWGDKAVLRAATRLKYLSEKHSAQGWRYFNNRHQIPVLVNHLYPGTNWPWDPGQGDRRMNNVAWTMWTHATR